MVELLRYLREYEAWMYLALAVLALWQIWKFARAWQELQAASYGMERENAQEHLNVAALWLTLFLFTAVAEFVVVSFVVPAIPDALPLPTPTLNLQATATVTLSAKTPGAPTLTPMSVAEQIFGSECISTTIAITSPKDGEDVSGVIELEGTANIPDMGFYKYEAARPGDAVWLSIQAGRQRVINAKLGDWDTRSYSPDDYLLRLVVTDNQGTELKPCIIRVRVTAPQSTAQP